MFIKKCSEKVTFKVENIVARAEISKESTGFFFTTTIIYDKRTGKPFQKVQTRNATDLEIVINYLKAHFNLYSQDMESLLKFLNLSNKGYHALSQVKALSMYENEDDSQLLLFSKGISRQEIDFSVSQEDVLVGFLKLLSPDNTVTTLEIKDKEHLVEAKNLIHKASYMTSYEKEILLNYLDFRISNTVA